MTTTCPVPASYSGPDRRTRPELPGSDRRHAWVQSRARGGRLLVAFGAGGLGTVALSLLAAHELDATTLAQGHQGIASLATALFVAAALAYLLRWKVSGEAPVAMVGVALLVYGGVLGLLSPIALTAQGQPSGPTAGSGPLRALVSAVAIALLCRSLATPTIDSTLRPGRLLALTAGGVVLGFGGASAALRLLVGTPPAALDVVLHAAVTIGWAATAALFVRRGARRLQSDVLWVGLALACLAVSNGVRTLSLGHSDGGTLAATALGCFAGSVALFGTSLNLSQLLAAMGAEQVRLRADLAASDRRGSAHEESRHRRQHDVRSALAAIRCAAGTLQRYDDRLAADQRVTLQTAVTSELQRLEQLIDPVQAPRAIVLFDPFPTAVGSGRVGALG